MNPLISVTAVGHPESDTDSGGNETKPDNILGFRASHGCLHISTRQVCPPFTIAPMFLNLTRRVRALQGMLSQYRGTKSRTSLEAATPRTSQDGDQSHPTVLPSSTELFYFYAQNLEQCAKLFTGQPLYDLCQLHKKWLRIYAGGSVLRHMTALD